MAPSSGARDRAEARRKAVVFATVGLQVPLVGGAGLKLTGLIATEWWELGVLEVITLAVQAVLWLSAGRVWDRYLAWDRRFLYVPMATAGLLLSLYAYVTPEGRYLLLMAWFIALQFAIRLAGLFQVTLLGGIMTAGYAAAVGLAVPRIPDFDVRFEVAMMLLFVLGNVYAGVVFEGLQKRRRKSRQDLAEAQRLAHLGSWELNLKSGTLFWSDELFRIFGLVPRSERPTLEKLRSWIHPEDLERVERSAAAALGEGLPFDADVRIVRRDGAERILHVQSRIDQDASGRPARMVGSALDVTARARAQEALVRASLAKDEFLANMSHEIRTPMHGIFGMTELLLQSDLPPQDREYAGIVYSSAEGLLKVIDAVLDFSKVQAGKLTIEVVDFPLRETVRAVVELLEPRATAKGIELRLDVAPEVPNGLRGDPTRLRQVLLNLVDNGIKFTSEGFVAVGLEPVRLDADEVEIRFCVRDTGIGIEPEAQPLLFTPFTQADSSTTRRYGGTGLGLAISQRIAELLSGEIEVESAPGTGSTFSLTLPFLRASRETAAVAPSTTAPAPGREGYRILVAEDERVNQLVARRMLASLGYQAEVVGDGFEVLAALERERFHLVLMDCQMPELDGYATTRKIRQSENAGIHLPIIAMTAHALRGDREKCLSAGMDDYISKPFKKAELARLLEEWLGIAR